jgi:hypothetical protein
MGEIDHEKDAINQGISQSDEGIDASPGQSPQKQFKKIHGVDEKLADGKKTDDAGDSHTQ